MARCFQCCKHYQLGVCTKYKERIIISKNIMHYGLPIHPLDYLTIYYIYEQKDIGHLIELAKEYLTDDTSKNICNWYEKRGYITFKQRKFLLYKIFNCYEEVLQ